MSRSRRCAFRAGLAAGARAGAESATPRARGTGEEVGPLLRPANGAQVALVRGDTGGGVV